MPDWCWNKLIIKGSAEAVRAFYDQNAKFVEWTHPFDAASDSPTANAHTTSMGKPSTAATARKRPRALVVLRKRLFDRESCRERGLRTHEAVNKRVNNSAWPHRCGSPRSRRITGTRAVAQDS